MNNSTLEGLLGMIVFGANADTPDGMQYTAARLRQAAALMEYRYAVERRYEAEYDGGQTGEQTAQAATQQAPARPKRQRGRPAKTANGQAPHEPATAAGEPLFQTERVDAQP
jgi:hypothetical protein